MHINQNIKATYRPTELQRSPGSQNHHTSTHTRDQGDFCQRIREEANRRGRGCPRLRGSSRSGRRAGRAAKGLPALASPSAAAASSRRGGRQRRKAAAEEGGRGGRRPRRKAAAHPPSHRPSGAPRGHPRRQGCPLAPHTPRGRTARSAGLAYRRSAAPGSPRGTRRQAAPRRGPPGTRPAACRALRPPGPASPPAGGPGPGFMGAL